MTHETRLYQVDAFAEESFAGNPAAVCLLESFPVAEWMQAVAAEMNLSETAFVIPRDGGSFGLRWFTPAREVDLCGHATLASAHVLWEADLLDSQSPARFHTRSGLLTAERADDGWIEMDFPATPADQAVGSAEHDAAVRALNVDQEAVVAVAQSRHYWLAELASESAVRGLKPSFEHIGELPTVGIVATARAPAGRGYDFVSRFFAPQAGVPEDPVTGSAHCVLAPWWAERLGRDRLVGYQASSRGGTVRMSLTGEDRVMLGGRALTVLEGRWVGRPPRDGFERPDFQAKT